MKKLIKIVSNSYPDTYTERTEIKSSGTRFSVRHNSVDVSPDANPMDIWRQFCGHVTEIHPYDEAEYAWARIGHRPGVIEYIRNGKVITKSYYMTAEDWDLDTSEWLQTVIDIAIENLLDINKDVEPRMVHN